MSGPEDSKPSDQASDAVGVLCDIDACCDRFESAWAAGDTPSLEAFLAEAPAGARDQLLRELLSIELEYRRDTEGRRLNAQAIIDLHPQLDAAIAEEFCRLPTLIADPEPSASPTDRVVLPDMADRSGLHIRCPHCENAVELLDDTPLGEITCRECGSNFTLVEGEGDAAAPPPAEERRIDRFELLNVLGSGAFGSVWKAYDTDLDRMVAIKVPRRGQLRGAEAEFFLREARAAAQLRHPNIVPVHEVGRDGDKLFIVSDLIHGTTMTQWLKQTRPDFREGAALVAKVADALQAAHERGVIHRDLKPSNVMVDEAGEPHLMDFGLAKRQTGEITMTVDGQVLGTPSYMSPEQAAGDAHWIDRRTDVYALGVMLFEVLTGDLPFRGSAPSQIQQRLEDDAPSPRRLNPRVPADAETICLKCLERLPNRRYATASDVADELRRFVQREPINARPISRAQRAWRWSRRNPYAAAALALTAVLAIAGPTAALLIYNQSQELAERLQRELNLIRTADQQSQQSDEQLRDLRTERDQLIGNNPGLAEAPADVRYTLASRFIDQHYAAAAEQIAALQSDQQRAQAEMGLGELLTLAGRQGDAVGHFRTAHEILSPTVTDAETMPALARCCEMLSRLLNGEESRAEAARFAEQAFALRSRLAAGGVGELATRVELLQSATENLRRLAGAAGDTRAAIASLQSARDEVDVAWSAEPAAVIELADALSRVPVVDAD